eukprot:11794649-Alexandrium_andersonii.AAC.1
MGVREAGLMPVASDNKEGSQCWHLNHDLRASVVRPMRGCIKLHVSEWSARKEWHQRSQSGCSACE